jgi:hypothetical protein
MPDPVCEALIFCELDIVEAQTSKHTLVGVFESLSSTRFPFQPDRFFVHGMVANFVPSGESTKFVLNIKNPEVGSIVGSAGIRMEKARSPSKIPVYVSARFSFDNIVFPAAGNYEAELLLNDELIGSRVLEIHSTAPAVAQVSPPIPSQSTVKTSDVLSDKKLIAGVAKMETDRQAAIKEGLARQKKIDPLVGLKAGALEIYHRLSLAIKDAKGVHIETMLTILGGLAGFACQMSIREELIRKGGASEESVFVIIVGADGRRYFSGDRLNQPLAESQYSIWSLAAGAAQKSGCQTLPDVREIFKHVASTMGGEKFGIPRIPDNHRVSEPPINWVKSIWPRLAPFIASQCDKPSEWPVLFGITIQDAIQKAKDIIDPAIAVTIVMECAVPMSKVELPEFYESPAP